MSFDITSYDARRRQTQECKDYQKTYQSNWIKIDGNRKKRTVYYQSDKYKESDRQRNQTPKRKKWIKDNCEKKRQEKLVIKFGVSTLKDFFS
mgnify:CR=1 FL=1|tara:strand:+ start:49 stop:324 length:276 start_codon:yes stop_codon:yes gene_type:complete